MSHIAEDLFLATAVKLAEGGRFRKSSVSRKSLPVPRTAGTAREISLAAALNEPIDIVISSTKTSVALVMPKVEVLKATAEPAPHYVSLLCRSF